MPIPTIILRRGDRGVAVTALHCSLESLGHAIDPAERDRRVFGPTTEAIIREVKQGPDGVFDDAARAAIDLLLRVIGTYTVHGRVLDVDGDPVVGASVFAVDVDLRREQVLGHTKTDCHGEYEIRYSFEKFVRSEKDSADLVVRAVLGDRSVGQSTVWFNAPMHAQVDLRSLERHGASEYERLRSEAKPLLHGDGFDTLKLTDVPFLVGETGRNATLWNAFIGAHRLSALVDGIPAAAFYAWLRSGLASEWDALKATPKARLRATLVEGIAQRWIDRLSDAEIDAILARVPNPAASEAGELLDIAVPAEVVRKLGDQIDTIDAVDNALLGNLVATNTLAPEEAERIGLSVSLHRLAGAPPSVVASLIDREFPGGKLRSARDLVAVDPEHWETALDEVGAPLPDGMTRAKQAREIGVRVASAYPEDAFRRLATRVGPTDSRSAARVERLQAVLQRNPNVSFAELDYLPDSLGLVRVDFGNLSGTERAEVIADLKEHQRVQAVTGNAVLANDLKFANLTSASAISALSVSHLAASTGWTMAEAKVHHATAKQIANKAALTWFGIYDLLRDHRTTPLKVLKWPETFFKPLQGYAGLVNEQAWCECSQCQSVLSPAAYFVDLMYFIERHILEGTVSRKQPLHLFNRRPDLWELELTCENTNEYVPYLDIVNEILERFLRDNVPFADNAALYKQLAAQKGSIHQPFTLPLERLTILLEHFGVTRAEIARAMQASPAIFARARLGLALGDYDLITTDRSADATYLLGLFRVTSTVTAADTVLADVEMGKLVRVLDLPHDTVEAILECEFVNTDSSTNLDIEVVLGKRDPNDVQNNTEMVRNLTLRRLDRIHRFTRLWRTLPWTVDELDYTLARLSAPNAFASIDAETTTVRGTLERIADLLELDKTWALPVDALLALVDVFPPDTLREEPPLFDRLFNQDAFVARDGKWDAGTSFRFTHPSWTATGKSIPADNSLARLLGGLQLSDAELTVLLDRLATHATIDRQPATTTASESIEVSIASITVLYRHATLRRLLGCTMAELFQLAELASTPSGFVDTLDDVRSVAKLAAWRATSGFSLDEIRYLLDTTLTGELDPRALAKTLVETTASDHSLELAETLFAQLGLTEAQSIELVQANLTVQAADTLPFERTAEAVRVRAIGLAGLVIPASLATLVTPAAIAGLLADRSPLHVADVSLGVAFGRPLDEVSRLRTIADPLDPAAAVAIARAIQGSTTQADIDRLELMIARLCRFHTLFRARAFDVQGLSFVATKPEVFFGAAVTAPLTATPAIDLDVVRNVVGYVAIASPKDEGFTTATGPAATAAIQRVLGGLTAATDADLAAALRIDVAQVSALRSHVALPSNPFAALAVLHDCADLGARIGVSGETLARMLDDASTTAYDQMWRAADDVYGAFRAKYTDPATFKEKITPFEDRLRSRKRDGLLDDFMTRWPSEFGDASKIYAYFLVDVLVQGCARTSRVVAGLSSLQLYVHRVLMNLERSWDWNPIDPNNPGVWAHFSDEAKRREWQWRKHYRVWEANRRVFLYPENYLEPELRDDKTPLFEELESTLLLQEIDKASVHDAYSRYLTGFDEVARLKIAGTFYDAPEKTLHVFGVTQDDAPVYYYRQVTETTSKNPDEKQPAPRFAPWEKLALQIPVRAVSPIVFEGRLYVFWVESTTRPVNKFQNGTSDFGGYRHTVRVKFSMLRADGAWAAPQVIKIAEDGGTSESRIVEDPRDDSKLHQLEKELEDKKKLLPDAKSAVATAMQAFIKAVNDQAAATANRIAKENAFKGPPTAGELAAMGAAAFFLGIPPEVTFAGLRAVALGEWKDAQDKEAKAIETTKLANDKYIAAIADLAKLNADIASLEDQIAKQVTMVRWDRSQRNHRDALDNYRPDGWQWDRVYPEVHTQPEPHIRLTLVPKGDQLPSVVTAPDDFDVAEAIMRELSPPEFQVNKSEKVLRWGTTALRSVQFSAMRYAGQDFYGAARGLAEGPTGGTTVANGPVTTQVQIVNGMRDTVIMETQGDSVWMRGKGTSYSGTRMSTSLTRSLTHQFWHDGADSLLAPAYQESLVEVRSKISPVAGQNEPARQSPFHPDHPCLTYFRETFFHIPFLVANHLNGQEKFADTQRWYHYIFDPTAATGDPWRYREFRQPSQITQSLRDLLVDEDALEAYRADPFSPHAIARTRMTAYQKAIVMKYVDNLLDWGDSLFNQFTMESINEATMLYVMAQDILGPRPEVLGSCGEGKLSPKNYNTIRPGLSDVSDFLVELEAPATVNALPPQNTGTVFVIPPLMTMTMTVPVAQPALQPRLMAMAMPAVAAAVPPLPPEPRPDASGPVGSPTAFRGNKGAAIFWTNKSGTSIESVRTPRATSVRLGSESGLPRPINGAIDYLDGIPKTGTGVAGGQPIIPFGELDQHGVKELDVKYGVHDVFIPGGIHLDTFPPLEYEPMEIVPPKELVFCIPPNKDLLAYWDRVEDRLFKIRNCRDITGARRDLALFSPELDPRLLVRMVAAGLSIDDVLDATSGNLPPYRFTYLIERAKQHATTVQTLGAALLSAFEKGDAEELSHLRTVHEQNLLVMRRHTMQLEIRAAEDTLESLRRQKAAVEYRHQHFSGLHEVGQIDGERKQQQLQGEASNFRTAAGIAQVVASILTIIPDMGAPTAMKFGGSQLGAAGRAVAEGLNALAAYNDTLAARAGVEASNQRRDQDWKHQIQNAKLELAQIEKTITAAEIRRDIATQALEIHEQQVKQTEEMFAFFAEKYASVDRYRLMQKDLRRLYRLAYNSALTLARMAEQAYRAERPEDITVLAGNYWDAQSTGLLAGERLMSDLQMLERQFIERNYRELEVEHSFSLAQFAPDALAALRVGGECSFEIPEWFFDLTYPGQYRRRLKAVRVTIPCVTGPHTNIGATLRLDSSEIRLSAPLANKPLAPLTSVPRRHTVSIATSKGQADAGVFDFSFRDERFMPFEGGGAVSKWTLSLPKALHVFDYNTISDVILHLDYTALHDDGLKDRLDGATSEIIALLKTANAAKPTLVRSFNLRTDFPDTFHRLVTNPANTEVGLNLEAHHFPSFLAGPGRTLETTAASLQIITPLGSLPGTRLAIGAKSTTAPQPLKTVQAPATPSAKGTMLSTFDLGDVMEAPLTQGGLLKTLTGNYVMTLQTTVDPKQLQDIVLRVAYRMLT